MSTVIETRIRPDSATALVDFAELRRYRDLLSMFVWRDFATKYKQTILGPIWFLVQPLLPALLFTVIFAQVAGMSTDGVPAFVFFLCNQVAWGYLSTNFGAISGALINNLSVFNKVYFPRLLVPISSLVSNLITLAIQLLLLAVAFAYARFRVPGGDSLHVTWALLFFPLIVLQLGAIALAFGLWMAAATAKYRDLQQVSAVLLQVWMYGSAVMFPLSRMPGKYRLVISANPATFAIEAARRSLIGVGTVSWPAGLWSVGFTLVMLVIGLRLFNRTAQTFVDVA
jgi:lipopolysaccharide transport system permease protein